MYVKFNNNNDNLKYSKEGGQQLLFKNVNVFGNCLEVIYSKMKNLMYYYLDIVRILILLINFS